MHSVNRPLYCINGNANTQMHRIGLIPFFMFYIDVMLNVDANVNVKCNLFKLCSHLTFTFAFASTSPSKFNIASMETQTQTHRMDPQFYIDAMLNIDANANVKCECTMAHDIADEV